MRTKVVSFFIIFQALSNKKKIKALRPKMIKIASRGPALRQGFSCSFPIRSIRTSDQVHTIKYIMYGQKNYTTDSELQDYVYCLQYWTIVLYGLSDGVS